MVALKYDAFIHIGWEDRKKVFPIILLDNFWGIEPTSIGAAAPMENELLFIWKEENGDIGFTNDFVYHPETDSWQWIMENVVHGTHKPLGRVTLKRIIQGRRGKLTGQGSGNRKTEAMIQ
jgi:hypothetical protein